ncbi:TPA: FKBP-type peptidyl-prolyl cis-trans isomerase [Escherichia coli]|nr:FKBP-type peptidyl-prolyl cis-trans isomerase [Escherichia coli]
MNDVQEVQQKTPVVIRITCCILCVIFILAGGRVVYATDDNQRDLSDDGIPGVLKYVQQHQSDKEISSDVQKKQTFSERREIKGNTELRRLTIRDQELHQLKKENKNKDKQIAELKSALDGIRGQSDELVRKAEKTQEVLNQQIIALTQQLSDTDRVNKTTSEQMEKEKAVLVSSLNVLKKEMSEMPVVTPELLKTESVQLTYAVGVMLGRDLMNIQAARQQLGLKTDNRILLAGIRDALNRKVLLNESILDSALQKAEEMIQKAHRVVIREQKKAGAAYLDNFRKQKGVKQAEGGFWYRTEYVGDGEFIRGDNTLVDVVVTEKLIDGTVIEDMDAQGRVISRVLSDYPPVFREALMSLKNHGAAELVVPSDLAYGDEGYPPRVSPGATMIYTLRVESVKPVAEETQKGFSEMDKKTTENGAEGDNK